MDNQQEKLPSRQPREGWAEAFQDMAKRGDDRLLDEYVPTASDEEEWDE